MINLAVERQPTGAAPGAQALLRLTVYLFLLVVACINLYVGGRGAQIAAAARDATRATPGELADADRLAVSRAYAAATPILGFYTWFSGMTGFYVVSLGFLFVAALALVGHVPTWWARFAIALAVLLILACWPYVDVISRLWVFLD